MHISASLLLPFAGTQVKEYHDEGFFGELSLLQDAPRAATVLARGELHVVILDRISFQNALQRYYNVLKAQTLVNYGIDEDQVACRIVQ